MPIQFTAHNIRLDDGSYTHTGQDIAQHEWLKAAKRALNLAFGNQLAGKRIADLGALEGGFAVELARLGLDTLSFEVRKSNYEACLYVKNHVDLPNLEFILDNCWNLENYGEFDAIFCAGLLYHLDKPRKFLRLISPLCKKLLILQTHFATEAPIQPFKLSNLTENEGLRGRWFFEHPENMSKDQLEACKWLSWENSRSFWIQREYLIGAIHENGFNMVFEQYDCLPGSITESMTTGYYKTQNRSMFIGVKTQS